MKPSFLRQDISSNIKQICIAMIKAFLLMILSGIIALYIISWGENISNYINTCKNGTSNLQTCDLSTRIFDKIISDITYTVVAIVAIPFTLVAISVMLFLTGWIGIILFSLLTLSFYYLDRKKVGNVIQKKQYKLTTIFMFLLVICLLFAIFWLKK